MARISAWAQLQYAAWPILIGAFALLAQMGNISPKYRWWGALLTTLAVYVAYQSTMVGMLSYVLLIEEYVRPRAAKIVETEEFWLHERVWRKKLPPNPAWSPWWPPVISFLAIVLVTGGLVYYFGLHAMDWLDLAAVLIALVLGVFVALLSRNGMLLSDEITTICNQSPIEIRKAQAQAPRRPRSRRRG
ncbi:MAG: hypothetical protein JOZ15_17265 [Acidobacteria bacterium]|nr:hypothetical protein [Acidobacteriota bacterium]